MPDAAAARASIEAVWKIESPRLIAALLRLVRDVGLAEELAQEAFLAALRQWPADGVPDNPGAWLMTAARRRAIDHARRDRRSRSVHSTLTRTRPAHAPAPADDRLDGPIQDDLLRLIFTACHPDLSADARAAFTLKLLCGLTTPEIARAFLVAEPTVAQRIVRARKTLAALEDPLELHHGPDLTSRLASVLEVLYLLFNEGYSAAAGDDLMRPALCEEALRLGRVLAGLMPGQPEVLGLLALMELQASRTGARTDHRGKPILLLEQDRARWDQLLIRRGLSTLDQALGLAPTPGPYTLQAAIAACHARALTPQDTDWRAIADHYERLAELTRSPVVELNRAVAVGMAAGPAAGLALVDRLTSDPRLASYHLLPAVRADLLEKLGRRDEARAEFGRAAAMAANAQEKATLTDRAERCRA